MRMISDNLKAHFLLDPSITFLNHGSFGATPRSVFASYQRWQRRLEKQPVKFLGRDTPDLLRSARISLSKFLNTGADNVVFVPNTTTGINIIARSLDLCIGAEVLATDHEYGALDLTWNFLAEKVGFKYIKFPIRIPIKSKENLIAEFWNAVTPITKIIFISHITSPTGLIFPIQEICAKARLNGILTVVDGAHAPGQIALNLDELGADFYVGNLHKWLCAPKGSAFLFARPEVQSILKPLVVSWGWKNDLPGQPQFTSCFEWTGTCDISAYLAVGDAIKFQNKHNWCEIQSTCHQYASEMRKRINNLTGLDPLCPDSAEWFAQMCSAQLPDHINSAELKDKLYNQFKIEVPIIEWNKHKLIRVSFQAYNSESDIDNLEKALKYLL